MSSAVFSPSTALVTKDLELFKEKALSRGLEALLITIPGKYLDSVNPRFWTRWFSILNRKSSSELDKVIHRINTISSSSTTGPLEERDYVLGPPAKKRKYCDRQLDANATESTLPNPSPQYIDTINNVLKLECETLVRITDDAKLWIVFSGGFNSDSSEDVITELHRAQASALILRGSPQSDCLKRAKLCNNLITCPGLSDYMSALREFDEERLFLAHQRLKDLQNIYIVLAECIRQSGIVV